MKVFVKPTGLHSRAMDRVAKALTTYAPPHVRVVDSYDDADVVVSHVIGPDPAPDKPEIIIQYCLASAGLDHPQWLARWANAALVWSYYDLPSIVHSNGFPFYHAPLGVDATFTKKFMQGPRDIGVVTSGYTTGPLAEAIEEVALTAWMFEMPVMHIGPRNIEGMTIDLPPLWRSAFDVHDLILAEFYRRSKWVSGLRHVEGFEMPAVEGLCCGARPIVFDRPDMHQWYTGHAVFVPESSGETLVKHLLDVLDEDPEPVLADERQWAIERFSWKPIVTQFWERVCG